MIQVLDKYGNTNNDEGRVLVFDKDGNIKRLSGGGGSGTVTSVSVTNGTGISASVANPTTTPNITITNTAPDQTVVLNNGTGISVTGTYPNFTITATGGSVPSLQAVTNIGASTTNNISITAAINPQISINDGATIALLAVNSTTQKGYLNLQYNDTFNVYTGTIIPGSLSANRTYTLPNAGGTIPLTVNGQSANSSGAITITVGSGTVTSVGAGTGMSFTSITTSGNVAIDTAKVPYYASAPSNGLLKYTSGTWGVDTNTYLTSAVTSVATAGLISGGTITGTGTITTSMATNKLVGRNTAGVGVMEEITLGTGLSFSGTTLNATVQSVGFEMNFLLMGA